MNEHEAIERLEYIKHVGNGEQEYKHCAEEIALDMAIKALEKQSPKKVVVGVRCKCPSCGEMFASDWKFCFECGQKLDWTVEE